jgi:hypothetical protein
MDAGIVDPGNIGARAVPCIEFSASLSPFWRADERTRTADLISLRVSWHICLGMPLCPEKAHK